MFVALTLRDRRRLSAADDASSPKWLFPHQANGSLIERDGKVVGSELIGQQFDDPQLFLGPAVGDRADAVQRGRVDRQQLRPDESGAARRGEGPRRSASRKRSRIKAAPVPVDLVTASGSGLDPHISPAAAEYQVARVAKARGLDEKQVRELVAKHTEGRTFGLLGEPRVNVLELNLALDELKP